MAITYEWSFPNFEVDSSNAVKTIHWRYTATETVGEDTYTASTYGSCTGADMNFDTITKDNCIHCVLENLSQSEDELNLSLEQNIIKQKNPEVTSKTKTF